MTSPIKPEICKNTGRILTEWFEFPEYDDQQLRDLARASVGLPPDAHVMAPCDPNTPPEQVSVAQKVLDFIRVRKRTKWRNGMTNAEIQARMNEATKMVSPDNFKFLPDDVRDRTGLEINPLWMMECLVRSGLLNPKEQVATLKELAAYTHSKAPTIQHNTHAEVKPEDWLLELATEEYKVVTEEHIRQPRQPVEAGLGKQYESNLKRRSSELVAISKYGKGQLSEFESMFTDDDTVEVDFGAS